MTKGIERSLTEKWGATLLTQETAGGFLSGVEELAKRAEIPIPKVYILDKIPGFGNAGVLNAAAVWKDKIIVTRPILELYGSSNLHGPMDQRLEAIIGHELSHCKHHTAEVAKRVAPLLLLPAAAMVGMYLYDKVKSGSDKETSKQALQENLNKETVALHQAVHNGDSNPNLNPEEKQTKHQMVSAGKYISAGVLGLATGILFTRYFSKAHEFRADKFGAKLVSPEAMADGLKVLHEGTYKLLREKGMGDLNRVKATLLSVLHAHPNLDERITHIMQA